MTAAIHRVEELPMAADVPYLEQLYKHFSQGSDKKLVEGAQLKAFLSKTPLAKEVRSSLRFVVCSCCCSCCCLFGDGDVGQGASMELDESVSGEEGLERP